MTLIDANLLLDAYHPQSEHHMAALAIEHGAVLCTTDRDFTRFRNLQTLNPLDS